MSKYIDKNNRKGFTLIELLAVIVILAVIALIATPIIMNVINDAKMGSFKDTAHGIIKAAELKVTKEQSAVASIYGGEVIDLSSDVLAYKGSKPKAGAIAMQADGTMALEMNDGEFCATKGLLEADVTVTKKGNKTCDGSGINKLFNSVVSYPDLKEGLIPITFDSNGKTVTADTNTVWYDYDNKKWANAVSVTAASRSKYQNVANKEVATGDILGYFVWIPRYKYQLWNAENGVSNPQEIKIEFEKVDTIKSNGTKNAEWLTHPAFTFGSDELNGIWVGKFETTGTAAVPTIKPSEKSLTNQNISTAFNMIQKMKSDTYGLSSYDTHMMKNSEWGAVAYLSHSKYGKNGEIWINNVNTGYGNGTAVSGQPQWGPSITGCSGASVSAGPVNNMTACEEGSDYKGKGINASTTGNITGIYDMSGGTWERTMGIMLDTAGNPIYSSSGFNATTMPDKKYFDTYLTTTGDFDFAKGRLGDATKEIVRTPSGGASGWYNDYSYLPVSSYPWFNRGGYAGNTGVAGVFNFDRSAGYAWTHYGSRVVLAY